MSKPNAHSHIKTFTTNISRINVPLCICIILFSVMFIITLIFAKRLISPFDTATTQAQAQAQSQSQSQDSIPPSVNPPPMQKQVGCPNGNDEISICNNYESCCNNMPATDCYCKNPAATLCKSQYDQCIANADIVGLYSQEQRKQMCSDQRGICCALYNSISGANKQYTSTAGIDQKVDQLCVLGLQQDIEIKCPELCSTNKNCASYSVNKYLCKLFSSANPIVPAANIFNKSVTNNDITYYKKQ